MRKIAISLALALLLVLALSPGAWALALDPQPDPGYGASAPLVYSCADITCSVGDTAIISVTAGEREATVSGAELNTSEPIVTG